MCRVCGWGGLESDPMGQSQEICSCCSFQFGYDDIPEDRVIKVRTVSVEGEVSDERDAENSSPYTVKENLWEWYRNFWVSHGMKWFDGSPPLNWDPNEQLKRIKTKKT